MITPEAFVEVGNVAALATSGRGFSADEIADMALAKIIAVSENSPPAIRDQAMAYRGAIRALLVHYMDVAKGAAATDLYNIMREHGQHDAAAIILKLGQGN